MSLSFPLPAKKSNYDISEDFKCFLQNIKNGEDALNQAKISSALQQAGMQINDAKRLFTVLSNKNFFKDDTVYVNGQNISIEKIKKDDTVYVNGQNISIEKIKNAIINAACASSIYLLVDLKNITTDIINDSPNNLIDIDFNFNNPDDWKNKIPEPTDEDKNFDTTILTSTYSKNQKNITSINEKAKLLIKSYKTNIESYLKSKDTTELDLSKLNKNKTALLKQSKQALQTIADELEPSLKDAVLAFFEKVLIYLKLRKDTSHSKQYDTKVTQYNIFTEKAKKAGFAVKPERDPHIANEARLIAFR